MAVAHFPKVHSGRHSTAGNVDIVHNYSRRLVPFTGHAPVSACSASNHAPPSGTVDNDSAPSYRLTLGLGGSEHHSRVSVALHVAHKLLRYQPADANRVGWLTRINNLITIINTGPASQRHHHCITENRFPMALKESAREWLTNLTGSSISLWKDLYEQFISNFTVVYEQPATKGDLGDITRRPGKTLRKYVQSFC
ncbi:hypothetical protein QYE76_011558 [Lolium multiflorum]|uniref:Retrotransposon gag domain-containing protein n=1 Tax=Lolium multiflorum TaxID=4521 RepID=A0AAD8X343_LOLMU|nr:hypothetical protein QYE76_011558 [Lolium multiflorum]